MKWQCQELNVKYNTKLKWMPKNFLQTLQLVANRFPFASTQFHRINYEHYIYNTVLVVWISHQNNPWVKKFQILRRVAFSEVQLDKGISQSEIYKQLKILCEIRMFIYHLTPRNMANIASNTLETNQFVAFSQGLKEMVVYID